MFQVLLSRIKWRNDSHCFDPFRVSCQLLSKLLFIYLFICLFVAVWHCELTLPGLFMSYFNCFGLKISGLHCCDLRCTTVCLESGA